MTRLEAEDKRIIMLFRSKLPLNQWQVDTYAHWQLSKSLLFLESLSKCTTVLQDQRPMPAGIQTLTSLQSSESVMARICIFLVTHYWNPTSLLDLLERAAPA